MFIFTKTDKIIQFTLLYRKLERMKRVDLKKKLLKKREKYFVAAKYAHMWIDLVIKGNYLSYLQQ